MQIIDERCKNDPSNRPQAPRTTRLATLSSALVVRRRCRLGRVRTSPHASTEQLQNHLFSVCRVNHTLGAVVRRRWFKKWPFVAEERLLVWERRLNIAAISLTATVLIPVLFYMATDAMGFHIYFMRIAFFPLMIVICPTAMFILCINLLLQFITDVWNFRWTAIAVLVHLPILASFFQ